MPFILKELAMAMSNVNLSDNNWHKILDFLKEENTIYIETTDSFRQFIEKRNRARVSYCTSVNMILEPYFSFGGVKSNLLELDKGNVPMSLS